MSRCMTAGPGSAWPRETGTEARHEISEPESPARPVNTAGNSRYNFGPLTFIHTHISGYLFSIPSTIIR